MSEDPTRTDRRSYLKYAGAAALTGLAGCSGESGGNGGGDGNGGGGATNHESPHPTEEVPSAEATAQALNGQSRPENPNQAKDNVGYEHSPNGDQHCGNCGLYVTDQNDDGYGACTVVQGTIHPCDWCNLWSSYDGDDTVPCEG